LARSTNTQAPSIKQTVKIQMFQTPVAEPLFRARGGGLFRALGFGTLGLV
jgi:hypothetical protein